MYIIILNCKRKTKTTRKWSTTTTTVTISQQQQENDQQQQQRQQQQNNAKKPSNCRGGPANCPLGGKWLAEQSIVHGQRGKDLTIWF